MRTRHDKLIGVDGAALLRRAAREMDVAGKINARIVEVEACNHIYAPGIRDIYYLERELPSGTWEAEGMEDIAGQGVLLVRRTLRDNLLPALTLQMIGYLIRGGAFNEFEPAKRYVLDDCRFRSAGKVSVA